MIRRILLSALLVTVLSCQNETAAPSAPQEGTGSLALRVVSAKALTRVDSVMVHLTWGSGSKVMRKDWRDSSLEITGLPRKETISVHMEGWSWVQGRRVIAWSGDTTSTLESANADWDMKSNGTPIRIVPEVPPSLGEILPAGDSIVGGKLVVVLSKNRLDTILLDTAGVDSVYLAKTSLPKVEGKFLLIVSATTNDTVVVVGHQGQTSWFRVAVTTTPVAVTLLGHTLVNDTLRVVMSSSRTDTVKMDTAGIDSVSLGAAKVPRRNDVYPLVVTPTTNAMVRVVGRNGSVDSFRVIGSAKPLSRDSLVTMPSFASWAMDTLKFEHAEDASDTIVIAASGVDSVVSADTVRTSNAGKYRIVVVGARSFKVVVTGKAGQKLTFNVVATAEARIVNKPGLGARLLSPVNLVVGKTCSLRVKIDSGEVTSVVLLKDAGISFKEGTDSVWSLVWTTVGPSDSLQVHVYGKGQAGKLDTIRIGKKLSFDRTGPSIALPVKTLLVGRSGGSIAWTISDVGGVDSAWFDSLSGKPCVDSSGAKACRADNVKKAFTIHARDALGNDSQATVTVVMDSVAPRLDSVFILGGQSLKKSNDTVWVDSGKPSAIRWKTSDLLIGFQTWLKMADARDSLLKSRAKAGGWDTASGLDVGTWTLMARDSLGNAAVWGSFVLATKPPEVITPADTTKELAMDLVVLPKWVGKTVDVKLRRTAGRVDSIVSGELKFTTKDSTTWSATWTPDTAKSTDSLRIKVHGHAVQGSKVIDLGQRVNLDRAGPKIQLQLPMGQSRDTLHVAVMSRDSLRIHVTDTNGVHSVWLTGTDATLNPSAAGIWTARMNVPGILMAHARDTLGNEDSLHVHVVFEPSANDTDGPKMDSVVGARGKLSGTNIPRKDDKGHVGLQIYSKEAKFVVKLWIASGEIVDTIIRAEGKNGIAVVDTIPMKYTGSLNMGLFDSLGNLGDWYGYVVLPFISAPAFSNSSSVYGSERIVVDNGVERLKTKITCQAGAVLRRVLPGGDLLVMNTDDVEYTSSVSYKYLCLDTSRSARSDTTEHEITLLLRPSFITSDETFNGTLPVYVSMEASNETLKDVDIQYCLGDSATCSQKMTWTSVTKVDGDRFFQIYKTTTVGLRVALGGVYSHATYRTFTKLLPTAPSISPKGGIMDYIRGYDFNAAGDLVVKLQCAEADGNSFVHWRDSGSNNWTTHNVRKDSVVLSKSKIMQFACVVGPDTSEISTQAYTLLKSPLINPVDTLFSGDSLDIILALSDSTLAPDSTTLISCVGGEYSTGNPEQRWCADGGQGWYDGREYKGTSFRIGLWYGETSITVWSKIIYKNRQSISRKRTYKSTTRTSW